jgi:hypothetical protein
MEGYNPKNDSLIRRRQLVVGKGEYGEVLEGFLGRSDSLKVLCPTLYYLSSCNNLVIFGLVNPSPLSWDLRGV